MYEEGGKLGHLGGKGEMHKIQTGVSGFRAAPRLPGTKTAVPASVGPSESWVQYKQGGVKLSSEL